MNRDPVDKEAIQEGNLLGNALPATVDTADLLSPSRHPEEQPLDMAAGLTKATKDQALVGQGVQVRLQGADLACRCRVVGSIDGVELGLGIDTLLQTARRPMSLDPAYEGMRSATEAAELGGAGE